MFLLVETNTAFTLNQYQVEILFNGNATWRVRVKVQFHITIQQYIALIQERNKFGYKQGEFNR